MGEDRPNNNAGGAVERVTAHEAAALLGVHYNTVRNRIKAGMYRAEKVHTENGPTWMIERDSLTDNAPTSARQQGVGGVSALQEEALQELARAIVREAGLGRDPEIERAREAIHGKLDTLKHITTMDGATVIALLLVGRAWELEPRLIAVTVGAAGFSFLLALMGYIGISGWLGSTDSALRHYTYGRYSLITFLSGLTLLAGVITFLWNVVMGPW